MGAGLELRRGVLPRGDSRRQGRSSADVEPVRHTHMGRSGADGRGAALAARRADGGAGRAEPRPAAVESRAACEHLARHPVVFRQPPPAGRRGEREASRPALHAPIRRRLARLRARRKAHADCRDATRGGRHRRDGRAGGGGWSRGLPKAAADGPPGGTRLGTTAAGPAHRGGGGRAAPSRQRSAGSAHRRDAGVVRSGHAGRIHQPGTHRYSVRRGAGMGDQDANGGGTGRQGASGL